MKARMIGRIEIACERGARSCLAARSAFASYRWLDGMIG